MKYLVLCLCLFLAPAASAQDGVGGIDRAYLVIVMPLPTGDSAVIGVDVIRKGGEPSLVVMPTCDLGPLTPDTEEAAMFWVLHVKGSWVVVPISYPATLQQHSVVTVPFHAEELK